MKFWMKIIWWIFLLVFSVFILTAVITGIKFIVEVAL